MEDIYPKRQPILVADLKWTLNFFIQKRLSRRFGTATATPLETLSSMSLNQSKK